MWTWAKCKGVAICPKLRASGEVASEASQHGILLTPGSCATVQFRWLWKPPEEGGKTEPLGSSSANAELICVLSQGDMHSEADHLSVSQEVLTG